MLQLLEKSNFRPNEKSRDFVARYGEVRVTGLIYTELTSYWKDLVDDEEFTLPGMSM